MRVVGYVRCSTDEQARNGVSLDAQRQAITAEAERRGWQVVQVYEDAGVSGAADLKDRPGLTAALEAMEENGARTLVVAKLDRLTRSLIGFAELVKRGSENGWELVVIDQGFDMTTAEGRAMAGMLAVFAQYERELIARRIKDALAVKRAQGVRLGRRSTLPDDVRERVVRERNAGATLQSVADGLNADRVATGQGGALWRPSAVKQVYESEMQRRADVADAGRGSRR